MVGATTAVGDCIGSGGSARSNCMGALGLGESGSVVRIDVHDCAAGPVGACCCCVVDGALCARSRPSSAAFIVAPWACQFISAGKPIGCGSGGAGHGRDAYSGGLPDAGAYPA